jgi:hypothetical protein
VGEPVWFRGYDGGRGDRFNIAALPCITLHNHTKKIGGTGTTIT